MSAIEKLFPTSPQERSFQMKARRDAGTAAPNWVPPQFVECKKCGRRATRQVWVKSQYVCPNCGVHLAIGAYYRLSTVLDHGTFKELNPDIAPNDVLHFPDYQEKLAAASGKTGLKEAAVTAIGRIGGVQAVVAVLDSRFFMGSMSTAVGEKITRAIEYAADKHLPLIIFSASGGARMQEGIFSLMQMAKTSAALERFNRSGGLYISVLTHPTTGGVTASFASLGDITLAEPGALIGFAGPRVIEQTIGEKLPGGFQRSEFQLEHGFVDQVVPRTELKEVLTRILQLHTQGRMIKEVLQQLEPLDAQIDALCSRADDAEMASTTTHAAELAELSAEENTLLQRCTSLTPEDRVFLARRPDRPHITEMIDNLFTDFFEQCGDRQCKEDAAILCGIARFHGMPVTVLGHRKGTTLEENLRCNFGMPGPEGYRKALRVMKQAEKFHRPIITFIDTPGAYPGKDAEERGQGEAIARNLMEMSGLTVPVLAIVTGEGSSGGALGLGVANHILMLENAVYSVLSPEGFASILWKDSSRSGEACTMMKLTAQDLYADGIVEEVIPEPLGGAQRGRQLLFSRLDTAIAAHLAALCKMSGKALAEQRYKKYRRIGEMRGA